MRKSQQLVARRVRKLSTNPSLGKAAKNRTPYIFEVLRDLCGLRE
jgi:hypothetical protein